ncbi:MAG: NAD-dependent epimerase/dehydratase family protein, partial [Chloroflexi bacterium]|nr:NAD-dependent epimerase/dehydratase family protein [Chloroflexota bacterium]
MNILVTGSSGFVGSAIVEYLKSRDQSVIRLVRDERIKGHDIAHWDPERGTIESERLVDIDAVVHLAGENLASGRWNTQRKARI